MEKNIIIKNARQNNLKNISFSIPYYKLNVVTGNSGSGKSSLVYDTIYAESQRLMFESLIDNTFGLKMMDKPDVDSIENLCPAISISQQSYNFNPNSTVGSFTDIYNSLRTIFSVVSSDEKHHLYISRDFSSMQSKYRCEKCKGTGKRLFLTIDKIIPDRSVSLEKGGIIFFSGTKNSFEMQLLYQICERHGIDCSSPIKNLSQNELDIILYGDYGDKYVVKFERGSKKNCQKTLAFTGVMSELSKDFKKINSPMIQKQLAKYTDEGICDCCKGTGFIQDILDCRVCGMNFSDMSEIEVNEIINWSNKVLKEYINKEYYNILWGQISYINNIIGTMEKLDIEYLSLNRSIPSLSGGEFQRLRLSKQIAGSLSEILYILDEPCKGLHRIDIEKIKNVSNMLIKKGNTILAIEHNFDYIRSANNVITIGPGSGPNGGEICENKDYSEEAKIAYPNSNRRMTDMYYSFENIKINNIDGESCVFPIGVITFITGVSGSGKSTLANDVIYNSLQCGYEKNCNNLKIPKKYGKVYYVDQKPIGKNARSTVISYLNIYDEIRKVYSNISVNKKKYKSSYFSTNCEGGRCEKCAGSGVVAIVNNYFPDSYIICDECDGKKFKPFILEVRYEGKNITDVLDMNVVQAMDLFKDNSKVYTMLKCIDEIGLGYLKLGQMSKNLSGGEAQRLKLAKAIGEENNKIGNIYILDEPTSGLSNDDSFKIQNIIQKLADENNTVIIIEHNIKFIAENADYIIDFGFYGGKKGGRILDSGYIYDVYKRKKASIWYESKQ